MATVLDVIRGLNQAAANAYDGALDEKDGQQVSWKMRGGNKEGSG